MAGEAGSDRRFQAGDLDLHEVFLGDRLTGAHQARAHGDARYNCPDTVCYAHGSPVYARKYVNY
jgi:hypothetical protein